MPTADANYAHNDMYDGSDVFYWADILGDEGERGIVFMVLLMDVLV